MLHLNIAMRDMIEPSENNAPAVGPIKRWGKCLVILTGASQGLGSHICEDLAPLLESGSAIVGIARSQKGLDETSRKVKAKNKNVQFKSVSLDLLKVEFNDLDNIIKESFDLITGTLNRALIIHNAGSLGKLTYLRNLEEMNELDSYFKFSLSTVISVNSSFIKRGRAHPSKPQLHLVNISSLAAVAPLKSWGLYCSVKVVRDALFRVYALEEPDILCLNYAPGPLNNEMQLNARTLTEDTKLREDLQSLKDENKLLEVGLSSKMLMKILSEGRYRSGDHVDYFDV